MLDHNLACLLLNRLTPSTDHNHALNKVGIMFKNSEHIELPSDTVSEPYDPNRPLLMRCVCGQNHSSFQGGASIPSVSARSMGDGDQFIESCLVKALFPRDEVRRDLLKLVGAGTVKAAIASLVPLGALQAMAQERGAIEKKDLKIGFIAITCASPLIMADPLGFYRREGLNVQLMKTAGWALIRDKMINKEHDASHFLSPMPIAMSLGLGSNQVDMNVASIQNTNGQAITLHVKHKDKRDPKQWKGFKFAVPFEYSMHNFLLRYYLADNGINPDTDVQIRVTPPPEMVANLRAGNIDGFLGPDPLTNELFTMKLGLFTSCLKKSGMVIRAVRLVSVISLSNRTPTPLLPYIGRYFERATWQARPKIES